MSKDLVAGWQSSYFQKQEYQAKSNLQFSVMSSPPAIFLLIYSQDTFKCVWVKTSLLWNDQLER